MGKEKSVLMKKLVVSVIIIGILSWRFTHGCLDYERNALMELMDSIHLPRDYMVGEDCCRWRGLECSSSSGRVTKLLIYCDYKDRPENYYFNASLFLPFHQLSTLEIYAINIAGCVHDQCFERLSELKNLESLHLYEMDFKNRSILSSIASISSLRSLQLYGIGFETTDEIQWLSKLEKLEDLDLSNNNFNNPKLLFPFIQELMGSGTSLKNLNLAGNEIESFDGGCAEFKRFGNLELLDLSGNFLDNGILSSLNHCFSLNYLYIDNNKLQGSINLEELGGLANLEVLSLSGNQIDRIVGSRGLCLLRQLEELDISYNEVSGTLPWCIANLTSLNKLDLSWNHFNGSISPLRSLTSLKELRFSSNQFHVPISLEPFFNHSKLKYLNAGNNSQIYEDEEIDVHNLSPKFQLQTLYLSSPGNGGAFPKFLYHQHDLQVVDLSNIKLKGEFPYWLLVNNTKLSSLSLANTSLSRPFQLPNNSSNYLLESLDISNNKFSGTIPTNIGQVLPNLQFLNLSESGFMGSIPSSFGKMRGLADLDLSNNRLSGTITEDLYIGCSSLYRVILSHNNFEGQILPKHANLNQLAYLLLDGNQFTGNIPNSLFNCTNLSILDVNNNHLSGNVPRWIGDMSRLQVLDLSNNSFFKTLPSHFCPYAIREIYLSNNQLQGSLDNAFYNCSKLMILDLSHNYLTGTIPKWIGNLTNLSYILLRYNQLQGALPIELCNIGQLSLVDLSNNYLSGGLLPCLRFISKQSKVVYDVAYRFGLVPDMQRSLEFTTKGITYEFRGRILKLISGIDFSCNNFAGEIPVEIGNFSIIKALNLSHNSLIGPIPQSFGNLMQIESLDLSYNNLNGKIPPQLTQLHYVSNFSIAHNNLSGKTPEMVGQFATFDKSSYEGNPLLCGLPLLESCQTEDSDTNSVKEEKGGFIDMTDFYVSFLISYVIVLLSIAVVLYINPYWRSAWLYFIEVSLINCYYFIEDITIVLRKLRALLVCIFLKLWSV